MTVGELLSRISSKELSEWMAYFQLEPFGEGRADLRMGILASLVSNMFTKKGSKRYTPKDFMPEFDKPKVDWREMLQKVKIINAMFNGKVGK